MSKEAHTACIMSHVVAFNKLLELFLSDLSASVPDVTCISTARNWIAALIEVDSTNDRVMKIFMNMLAGSSQLITEENPAIFQNFSIMPSMISQEDMWGVFKQLDDKNKKVCWKYLSKLHALGKKSLIETGEYDEQEEMREVQRIAQNNNELQSLVSAGPQGLNELSNLTIPDGPIVMLAFNEVTHELGKLLLAALPGDERVERMAAKIQAVTDNSSVVLLEEFKTTFPSNACSALMTQAEETVLENGIPFLEGGSDAAKDIISKMTDTKDLFTTLTQLGTIAITLVSIDSSTIDAVEQVTRDFVKLLKSGDIDISKLSEDPFTMLQTLADSGVADGLMEILNKANTVE